MDLLEQIKSGARIARPVTFVLAHPDDETASAGGLLQRLRNVRLIYLTDGAPRDLVDAQREGFDCWRDYSDLRRRELALALQALGVGAQPVFYDYPDKEAIEHLNEIAARLVHDLRSSDAVVTHPYENGHPDHDSAAVAVALACERLGDLAPGQFEFASYHLGKAGRVFGAFWPGGEELVLNLSPQELGRKRNALAAYSSQTAILAEFPLTPERYRRAPDYDFTAPAAPGRALYDEFGWDITSERWRARLAGLLA